MTIPEILRDLDRYTGRFPGEAMKAAIEQREAITPELLRVVQEIAESPAEFASKGESMLPVLAIYLLAQFGEKTRLPRPR